MVALYSRLPSFARKFLLSATINPLTEALRSQLFNETYLEREEDSIIRLRTLEDESEEAHTVAGLKAVYRCAALRPAMFAPCR